MTTRPRRRFGATALLVLGIGLLVTAVLAVAARRADTDNERQLVRERAAQAGAVLEAAVPSVEIPLSTLAAVAEVSDPDELEAVRRTFTSLIETGRYSSVSLWEVDGAEPVMVVGSQPAFADRPRAEVISFLAVAATSPEMVVVDLLDEDPARLGYGLTTNPDGSRYVVYAEQALPGDRTEVDQPDPAFAGVDYALYLGPTESNEALVAASTDDLPLEDRRASRAVPFGDTDLLFVVSADDPLGPPLLRALPLIVLVLGIAASLAAAILVARTSRRARDADASEDEDEGEKEAEEGTGTVEPMPSGPG